MARRLIQVAPGVNPGDAITNEIRIIDRYFRSPPFHDLFVDTAVFAEHIHASLADFAQPAHRYRPLPGDFVLYHYGIAARITEQVRLWHGVSKALIYHNITPAEYYRPYSLYVAARLERARRDLRGLRDCFDLVFADSRFNGAELAALGYQNVRLLPVLFENGLIPRDRVNGGNRDDGAAGAEASPRESDSARNLRILFVGRIAPNKGHADLIKIFYYIRRQEPRARLILAGEVGAHSESYREELERLVRGLDLSDSVEFTGFVSDERLAELYGVSDVFLSASAHEGFCVPLLEAMRSDLPVVAYASPHSAVGETMSEAGVVFRRMEHPAVAELVLRLLYDADLRQSIVIGQRERVGAHDNRRIFERNLYAPLREVVE
ncbi:MAG: glycosyltransferase family 4 protein [bacterium]|nr:glycosyltransferase family 4 protein [bacterium]